MAKKIFLVDLVTTNVTKEWCYEPGTEITVPVLTNSAYNARRKVENRYWGSEFPTYDIKSVRKCDYFLFRPMLGTDGKAD